MSQENIDDTFSKNMFGTEEVKAEAPKEEEDEDKLNEEEERILENVK